MVHKFGNAKFVLYGHGVAMPLVSVSGIPIPEIVPQEPKFQGRPDRLLYGTCVKQETLMKLTKKISQSQTQRFGNRSPPPVIPAGCKRESTCIAYGFPLKTCGNDNFGVGGVNGYTIRHPHR